VRTTAVRAAHGVPLRESRHRTECARGEPCPCLGRSGWPHWPAPHPAAAAAVEAVAAQTASGREGMRRPQQVAGAPAVMQYSSRSPTHEHLTASQRHAVCLHALLTACGAARPVARERETGRAEMQAMRSAGRGWGRTRAAAAAGARRAGCRAARPRGRAGTSSAARAATAAALSPGTPRPTAGTCASGAGPPGMQPPAQRRGVAGQDILLQATIAGHAPRRGVSLPEKHPCSSIGACAHAPQQQGDTQKAAASHVWKPSMSNRG